MCYQFSSGLRIKTHLEVNQLVIIQLNLPRVILSDEVVKCCKCRWNEGLNIHVILWWKLEDSKMLLEDPKDLLNDIAS